MPRQGLHPKAEMAAKRASAAMQSEAAHPDLPDVQPSVDVMLTEYCCHDESFMQSLEGEQRSVRWKLEVNGLPQPIIIQLHVSDVDAGVEINGSKMLPRNVNEKRVVLEEDFEYQWPRVIGAVGGIHERNVYEFQPGFGCRGEPWYPATITGQRADGAFDVVALLPKGRTGMQREVAYPGVSKKNLRLKASMRPPESRKYSIMLKVPKQDPRAASIVVDGRSITRVFSRPTPPNCKPGAPESSVPRVRLHVNKARSVVTADVDHATFSEFLSNEPRNVAVRSERMKKMWTLGIGPSVEHHIVLEKRFVSTDIFTLTVDGTHMVEASAQDLRCKSESAWQCRFCFVGDRLLEFDVQEEDWSGQVLESRGAVCHRLHTTLSCCVTFQNDLDFSSATLAVNGQEFLDMRHKPDRHALEPKISTTPETMLLQYDVRVPHRVSEATARGSLASWAAGALARWGLDLQGIGNCCQHPSLAVASVAPGMSMAMSPQSKEPLTEEQVKEMIR